MMDILEAEEYDEVLPDIKILPKISITIVSGWGDVEMDTPYWI